MGFKTVTCVVCKEKVSKRSTLQFGDGRACRDHQELADMLDKKRADEELEHAMKIMDSKMRVISMTAMVRAFHTIHGTPVSFMLARFRTAGVNRFELKQVEDSLRETGATMSSEEIVGSLLAYSSLKKAAKGDGSAVEQPETERP